MDMFLLLLYTYFIINIFVCCYIYFVILCYSYVNLKAFQINNIFCYMKCRVQYQKLFSGKRKC